MPKSGLPLCYTRLFLSLVSLLQLCLRTATLPSARMVGSGETPEDTLVNRVTILRPCLSRVSLVPCLLIPVASSHPIYFLPLCHVVST